MVALPPFVDPDTYQAEFGAAPADGILRILDAASTLVRSACRWHVWPSLPETLTLDGPGRELLALPTLRLTELTAVSETQRGKGQSPVTVDLDDVEWSASGLVWRHDRRCWTSRARGLTVTFSHGWEGDPPADVAQVVLAVAGRARANPLRLVQMTVGQRSEAYGGNANVGAPGGLLLDEYSALAPYRRVV